MTTTTTKNVGGTSKPVEKSTETPYSNPAEVKTEAAQAAPYAARDAAKQPEPAAKPTEQPVAKPADKQIEAQPDASKPETNRAATVKSLDDAAHDRYDSEAKEKAKADKPYPAVEQKVQEPKNGLFTIVIDGIGTMPLIDNGGRRVLRGEPIEVSQDELHWLSSNNCGFKRV